MLERGDQRHYVIDVAAHYRLAAAQPRRVLVLRRPSIALGVESVDRMTHVGALYALPRAFTGEERRWYRGLALVEGRVVALVNPDAFLTKAELAALDAAIPVRATTPQGHGAVSA